MGRGQAGEAGLASDTGCGDLACRPENRNIIRHQTLLSRRGAATPDFFRDTQEGTMATRDHDQIVETAREARGAEPGPSVLALLTVSTGLAVLILGVVWFVFFRT
jgi:hypothetical protein